MADPSPAAGVSDAVAGSAPGEILLSARSVSRWFGATQAIRDVSLDVRAGEIHALVGANGSGKSSLIKILSGVDKPDLGEVAGPVGEPAAGGTRPAGLGIGTVHQELGLFSNGTVAENLFALQTGRYLSFKKENELAQRLLRQVGARFPVDAIVNDLTIEEQARLAVARALAVMSRARQSVLIVDEVTSVLRGQAAKRFLDVLRQLRDDGVGIVFVSHDLDEVLGLADMITVLRDGTVQGMARPADTDRERIIGLMTGGLAVSARPTAPRESATADAMLSVEDVHGSLVHGISLDVRPGEIVGVTGVAGSGYDEIPYLVAGSATTHAGRVFIAGRRVSSPPQFAGAGGRIIPADRHASAIVSTGSILENFMLDHRGGRSRFGISRVGQERRIVQAAVQRYNVKCASIDAPIATLSGGNQQKLILGRCIESRPRVLVVHEPTQGVDVQARSELLALMRHAVRELRMGVLYVSGELDEVWESANRVLVVRRGVVVGELAPERDRPEQAYRLQY